MDAACNFYISEAGDRHRVLPGEYRKTSAVPWHSTASGRMRYLRRIPCFPATPNVILRPPEAAACLGFPALWLASLGRTLLGGRAGDMDDIEGLLRRAGAFLEHADLNPLARTSAATYRRTATRLLRRARTADGGFVALSSRTLNTALVDRAAWRRLSLVKLASAVTDLRGAPADVHQPLRRIRRWTRELATLEALGPWRPPAEGAPPSRSKRTLVADLPGDWLDVFWSAAVTARTRHLDALAVLIVSGCRAQEVCHGCAVRVAADSSLEVGLAGAKVRAGCGQPWRLLRVAGDTAPARHLMQLAVEGGGTTRVKADCTPNALSMRVAAIASDRFGRRVSAHDFRHQRCADARNSSAGDMDFVARFMGHTSTSTARFYARLPRAAGVRGALPLAADAPRPVRHPAARLVPGDAPGP